jgi:CheY-like chemotaxis protein
MVSVDAARLVQAVSNLLHNAAKFTPAGGRVELAAGMHDGEILIAVTDTGIGFSSDLGPRLFEMFVQGEHGIDRKYDGLGIGLALCRHVVELHGGTIRAASEGTGRGARFEIRIPVTLAVSASDPANADAHGHAGTVVIVDDNRDAARAIELLVEELGGRAHVAHDGTSGIELVREHAPELVFLDLGMPSLDGYEVCRRLREEMGCTARIIALTGWGKDEDKARARDVGFDEHITKPADPSVLRRIVTGARP